MILCKNLIVVMIGSMLMVPVLQAASNIVLPPPQKTGGMPLMEALEKRRSGRQFMSRELSPQILSNLLWAACGINRDDGRRTAPTASNRQEIEVYVAMKDGAYAYVPAMNILQRVVSADIRKDTGKQGFVSDAPVVLVFTADYDRMSSNTKDLYAAVDTGYVSQNVYLYCASAGLETVVLGMVDRDALHAALGLAKNKKIMFTQPVGYAVP